MRKMPTFCRHVPCDRTLSTSVDKRHCKERFLGQINLDVHERSTWSSGRLNACSAKMHGVWFTRFYVMTDDVRLVLGWSPASNSEGGGWRRGGVQGGGKPSQSWLTVMLHTAPA